MRYFFPLIVVVVIFYGLFAFPIDGAIERGGVAVAFGFLMISAYFVGKIVERVKLPKITGYIACGILFGPHFLNFIDARTVSELRFIDGLALTFIALAAGGELKIRGLKERAKAITITIVLQIAAVFLGTIVLVFLLGPSFGLVPKDGFFITLSVGLICASVMSARSPSTMMAVISETRAEGPFTETVMGVTVVMDVVVLVLFSLSVAVSSLLIYSGSSLNSKLAFVLIFEIGGALAVGGLLGLGLILYIRYINKDLSIILLLLAILVTSTSHFISDLFGDNSGFAFYLNPLLICITTGFVVENFSPQGEELLKTIDESSLPLYVVFFALAGTSLNLGVLAKAWPMAILLVMYRLFALWMGSRITGSIVKDPVPMSRWMGVSYMAQAGVSIGLASEIAKNFPDWGIPLASIILSVVAINQLLGPVALKLALERVGEVGRREVKGKKIKLPDKGRKPLSEVQEINTT